jgi:hypothetical protein
LTPLHTTRALLIINERGARLAITFSGRVWDSISPVMTHDQYIPSLPTR